MIYRNLLVAELDGYRPLTLDLRIPQGDGPFPVLVWVHGGGWRSGSPRIQPWTGSDDPIEAAVLAGYAVAAVEYRLSAEAVFPAQLDDVRAAVGWLCEHGASYGVDSDRVGIWGESAGGLLASLAALTDGRIGAAVIWYGPSHLTTMQAQAHPDADSDKNAPGSAESRLIGAPVQTRPDLAAAASPVTYVSEKAPPMLLIHGDRDISVSCAQSIELADALSAAGAHADLVLVADAGHRFEGVDHKPLIKTSLRFFDKQLRP